MTGPRVRPSTPASLSLTAGLLAVVATVTMLLAVSGWAPLIRLDRGIATGLHEVALHHPGWTRVQRFLSDWVWDPWTVRAVVAVLVLSLWRNGERMLALWFAVTLLVANVTQQVLKAALGRDRPQWAQPVDEAHFAAMPSGHAMTAAVGLGLLCWFTERMTASSVLRITVLALSVCSVVGVAFTRLFLGVHWFTDTLVGVLLGVAMVLAVRAQWLRNAPDAGAATS
ncbi:phosphatase PAP2 family protein [Streptomyces sp. NPDC005438]|uniref:phosphatase PAP2 family protein n=1 Tax=Streptomyces sp. NPDC005438 TaxID=3156880 RepID=UPI00339DBC62